MNERIKDKIAQIKQYLEELNELKPSTLEDYLEDFTKKAACERYAEKITQALVDLAFLVVKEKKLRIPEEDEEAFDILAKAKVISQSLAIELKNAKGMRNILAHEYGKVNDEIVFNAVDGELERDAKEFIKDIERNELSKHP